MLSTIAAAMITTAGVVFSLTVVSLRLASSQFSSRVMRSFLRDRLSQLVIGLLVATFVFCVLALRHSHGDGQAPAPRITMTLAIVRQLTHEEYIAHGFDQLRQAAPQPHVVAALLRVLRMLMTHVRSIGRVEQVPAL